MADDFRRVNAHSDLGSQADVKRWVPQIMPLLTSEDPLGVESFATHHLPLDDAPGAYETFEKKEDGMIKVVLTRTMTKSIVAVVIAGKTAVR